MLIIRLQRIGKRGQAYFRVIVTEHTKKPQGKYLASLGSYDPHKKNLTVNGDLVKEWVGKGAQMSATVRNLFIDKKIIEGEKVLSWKPKKKEGGAEAAEKPATPQTPAPEASETPDAAPAETAPAA